MLESLLDFLILANTESSTHAEALDLVCERWALSKDQAKAAFRWADPVGEDEPEVSIVEISTPAKGSDDKVALSNYLSKPLIINAIIFPAN